MKTYCLDLDGTLCLTEGMDYAAAKPRHDVIAKVNRLYDEGHHIIIETARGTGTGEDWTAATHDQLIKWRVQYHELRCGVKIVADVYVDDRGVNVEDWI